MTRSLIFVCAFVAASCLAAAQVPALAGGKQAALKLTVDQATFLQGEPIFVTVTAARAAGPVLPCTLAPGGELRFAFDPPVKPQRAPDRPDAFPPAEPRRAGAASYNLLDFYALGKKGETVTYTVRAVLRRGEREEASPPVTLVIETPGLDLDKQALGRLHHLPWINYETNKYCGDTFDLVKQWPGSRLARYAHFYSGRFLQNQKEWKGALTEFEKVTRDFPRFALTAAAAYQIGVCLTGLGERERARAQWQAVVRDYPGTDAADDARAALRTAVGAR